MDEREMELRAERDGFKMAVEVFLNAPLRRAEFATRFGELEEAARKQNAHAATIEVLRTVRARLSD